MHAELTQNVIAGLNDSKKLHSWNLFENYADPSLPSATPFDPTQFRLLFQQRLMEIHKELYPMQSSEKISSGTTSNEGLDLSVNNFCRTQSDNEDEYFEEDEYENEIEVL